MLDLNACLVIILDFYVIFFVFFWNAAITLGEVNFMYLSNMFYDFVNNTL